MFDTLLARLQYLLPHHLLTWLIHKLARIRTVWFKNAMIRGIAGHFGVNWSEALHQSPDDYEHFNAFFTRQLKPEARPLAKDEHALLCPVDGAVSSFGKIRDNQIFQAKGHDFSCAALLADEEQAKKYNNGEYITIYLSPKDYHRIHMAVSGELTSMSHVPGRLFSVAPYTVDTIPRLFARNERSVHHFDTSLGPHALVLVGAMLVASMETVWHGLINPPRAKKLRHFSYPAGEVTLKSGEEMGRFNMGSTVVLLFPENTIQWQKDLQPGNVVRMGEPLGNIHHFSK
ncbi:MAG: phosphatidylserine decarboxylase [Proteobacteria bacterium]|nr:phosphatidylserine decarboxylase [Pseudomonadota bacterium]